MSEHTVSELLDQHIDERHQALWDKIKGLPNTSFSSTEESLKVIEAIGREAGALRLLRKASHVIRYPAGKEEA